MPVPVASVIVGRAVLEPPAGAPVRFFVGCLVGERTSVRARFCAVSRASFLPGPEPAVPKTDTKGIKNEKVPVPVPTIYSEILKSPVFPHKIR